MSTTKAMVAQQKRLLGVARGMAAAMQLAAMATDGMQRAMSAFDEKAAVRAQQGIAAVEQAMEGLAEPIARAADGLRSLNEAVRSFQTAQESMAVTMPEIAIRMASAVTLPQEPVAAPVQSPQSSLEEKIKKDVIPDFVKFGELVASFIPLLQLDKKKKTDSELLADIAALLKELHGSSKAANAETYQLLLQMMEGIKLSFRFLAEILAPMSDAAERISTEMQNLVSGLSQSFALFVNLWAETSKQLGEILDAIRKLEKPLAQISASSNDAGSTDGFLSQNDPPLVGSAGGILELAERASQQEIFEAPDYSPAVAPDSRALSLVDSYDRQMIAVEEESAEKKKEEPKLPDLKAQVGEMVSAYKTFMTENEAVSKFIADNWSFFGGIYDGVNVALKAYNALQLVSKTVTVISTAAMYAKSLAAIGLRNAWNALNATMKANVIVLIISLLIGLGAAIMALWKNNDAFAEFFIRVWHGILNFFDQIPVIFWDISLAVIRMFQFLNKFIGGFFDTLFQAFKNVVDLINKITNSNITIPAVSFEDALEKAENYVSSKAADARQKAADNQAKREENLQKLMDDRAKERAAKELAELENEAYEPPPDPPPVIEQVAEVAVGGGRIDEIGKVNDTVDISSEDLKTMRELAEMKNIQNFVTLQPSVNVQTGDIRNGVDVSSMIQAITTALQDEIAASAEGVYR